MRILNGGYVALGVAVGCCLTLLLFFAFEFFNTVLTPDSAVWAAMIGAIVGGAISLAGQLLASENERRRREMDLERINLANAYTLFETLLSLHSNISAVKRHCEKQLQEAIDVGEAKTKYLGILPLSGRTRPSSIAIESKVLLMSTQSSELYNKINNVDQFVLNLLDHFDDLQVRRSEALQLFDVKKIVGQEQMAIGEGNADEFVARYSVLEKNFVQLLSDIDAASSTLAECLNETVILIKRLGNDGFGFELKATS